MEVSSLSLLRKVSFSLLLKVMFILQNIVFLEHLETKLLFQFQLETINTLKEIHILFNPLLTMILNYLLIESENMHIINFQKRC